MESDSAEHSPRFSPDGRWIVYVSDESGRDEVYVRPYPSLATVWPISSRGGVEPVWAPDSKELFYRNRDRMMVVSIRTTAAFAAGKPEILFEGRAAYTHRPDMGPNYDVTPDGRRFLMVQSMEEQAPAHLTVVLNWFEELKRLIPVD